MRALKIGANIIADIALRNALRAIAALDAEGRKVLHVELRGGRAVIEIEPPGDGTALGFAGALCSAQTRHGGRRTRYVVAQFSCQVEWEKVRRDAHAVGRRA